MAVMDFVVDQDVHPMPRPRIDYDGHYTHQQPQSTKIPTSLERFSFECEKVIGFAFAFGFHAT